MVDGGGELAGRVPVVALALAEQVDQGLDVVHRGRALARAQGLAQGVLVVAEVVGQAAQGRDLGPLGVAREPADDAAQPGDGVADVVQHAAGQLDAAGLVGLDLDGLGDGGLLGHALGVVEEADQEVIGLELVDGEAEVEVAAGAVAGAGHGHPVVGADHAAGPVEAREQGVQLRGPGRQHGQQVAQAGVPVEGHEDLVGVGVDEQDAAVAADLDDADRAAVEEVEQAAVLVVTMRVGAVRVVIVRIVIVRAGAVRAVVVRLGRGVCRAAGPVTWAGHRDSSTRCRRAPAAAGAPGWGACGRRGRSRARGRAGQRRGSDRPPWRCSGRARPR